MELELYRTYPRTAYTIGQLFIGGSKFCDTLELPCSDSIKTTPIANIRAQKIARKTAIPRGRYEIDLTTKSPKFSKYAQYKAIDGYLPRLEKVPAYEGVLIHIGNLVTDTEGCILVGKNTAKGTVTSSRETFYQLYELLTDARKKGEPLFISIF